MTQAARVSDLQLPSVHPDSGQTRRLHSFRPHVLASAIGLACCAPAVSFAQATPAGTTAGAPAFAGQRLSDWLLQQRLAEDAYLTGLSWRAASEQPTQAALKSALRVHLLGSEETFRASPEARRRLSDWIKTLPVTGRVPVAVSDPRYLQAKPALDPVLEAGHSVVVPRRPTTVTVITSDGRLCAVPHVEGRTARAYLNACRTPALNQRVERVWLAQPDGRVQNFGIAAWNAQTQGEPAPGAWIWAPERNAGWEDGFSASLVNFLATQGPAPDSNAQLPQARLVAGPTADPSPYSWDGLASSFTFNPPLRDRAITGNDWGGIGLLQTPTARMAPAGDISVSYSRAYPFWNLNVTLQPLDWMEVSYRYSSVNNELYGPAIAGDQSYKDKSIDVKVKLLNETAWLPEVAVGARDVVGTGLFSGEYFVANKRTGNFDWSLGIGWGHLGSAGDFRNPLSVITPRFDTRSASAQSGDLAFNYFRGPTALFGGVQVQTPWDPLLVKLEYEGNDYSGRVPRNPIRKQPDSRFNAALVYRYTPSIDVTVGVERGNTAMFSVALHAPLPKIYAPKLDDPALPRFTPARPAATTLPMGMPADTNWTVTAEDILAQTGWRVSQISKRGEVVYVELTDADAVYWREMIDRAAAVLHRDAPADVQEFRFQYRGRGALMADVEVNRNDWVKAKNQPLLPAEQLQQKPPVFVPPAPTAPLLTQYRAKPDRFDVDTGFRFSQNYGGPDAFLLYALSIETDAEWRITDDTWASGSVNYRLLDNYSKFDYTAPSRLPRVRTLIREFNTTSRVTIPNLQLTHMGQLNTNQFFTVYGGLLESMYAGVGAEWMYRPFRSPVALGVDVNAVRQRDFDQKLDLRDYSAKTGHITGYWETGWNDVVVKASVGQYLAKDKGATLDLSRRFANGVTFGAYATKTNVSSRDFGEGSFDKGIYFTIPLSAVLTRSTPAMGVFAYNPLIRDGGAKLNRYFPLFDLTSVRDRRALSIVPGTQNPE
ncbi:MAG: YjbH domain-containing protein [Polaromonas sp.]|nr:YjbH domain-containing protein [Polaromonas sp.]